MTKKLAQNIENIPPLPKTIQEIEEVYKDPNATIEDFDRIIQKDPILVADILHLVNSPMYGLKSTVNDLKQAIGLLGKDAIRTFVMSSVLNTNFTIDMSAYGMSEEQFVNACKKQMSLMINWVIRRDRESLSLLGPASFLVDIGRVVISSTLVQEGKAEVMQQALANGEDIAKIEKEICGAKTTDVTATLFNKWGLDPEIVHVIRYSDDPEGCSHERETQLAAYLKAVRECVLPNGDITEESIALAKETIEEYELDLEAFENAVQRVQGA